VTRRLAALLTALLLALVGCDGGGDAQALLDGAVEALEAAGTSSFEMAVETVGQEDSGLVASGAQDLNTGAMRMSIDLGDEATSTETLMLGDEVFLRSPLFELFTGDAATWVRVDLAATAEEAGLDARALVGEQTGPAALVAQLEGASDELEELGTEEVRGVSTTRLRVTVDTAAAIEQADASIREQLRSYAEATGLPETYPMELWIDDEGLVRRIRTVLDVDGPTGESDGVTQQTTLELFDFGVSLDLEPPLPEQTVDLAELVRDLERLEELGESGALDDEPTP
jgi:hypothetical protein